jgi:hypothetical protein
MFDELKPDDVPVPPPHALESAMHRGTGIRRRRRAAWASGVAAVAVLVVVVVLGNPFSTTNSATVVPATVTATPAAPKDYSPIPLNPTEEKDGVSFGYLQKITKNADGSLTLRIEPGTYLTDDAAAEANGGTTPPDSYLDNVKEDTKPADFRLDPKASLLGVFYFLGDIYASPTQGTPITAAKLAANFKRTDAQDVHIWFRLADDGSITALREQFVP